MVASCLSTSLLWESSGCFSPVVPAQGCLGIVRYHMPKLLILVCVVHVLLSQNVCSKLRCFLFCLQHMVASCLSTFLLWESSGCFSPVVPVQECLWLVRYHMPKLLLLTSGVSLLVFGNVCLKLRGASIAPPDMVAFCFSTSLLWHPSVAFGDRAK